MSSAALQLASVGHEDRWLTESPDRTFFEVNYKSQTNRTHEANEIPFDNINTFFGKTAVCTLPNKGDFLTRLTLRATLPPIYPTESGEYVFPTPSSQVGGNVYAQKTLTLVVADGITLTANTIGNHYLSIGAQVILTGTGYSIFDLDGTYTVATIPTANSFTCATTLAGVSYQGTMSFVAIACADIVSYFATQNSNLWVNNLTNKTWQITSGSITGTQGTFTTSAPSNFPVGSQVVLNLPRTGIAGTYTVSSSTDTTFSCEVNNLFLSLNNIPYKLNYSYDGKKWNTRTVINGFSATLIIPGEAILIAVHAHTMVGIGDYYSIDNGQTWFPLTIGVYRVGCIAYGNGVFVAGVDDYGGPYGVYISIDNGQTWNFNQISLISPSSGTIDWVCFGNGVFIGTLIDYNVGPSTRYIIRSTDDGQTWSVVNTVGPISEIIFADNAFICSDGSTLLVSDQNGLNWQTYSQTRVIGYLAYGNGTLISVDGDGYVGRSTNNQNFVFTYVSVLDNKLWQGLTFGVGVFVLTGVPYSAYSIDDGLTWTIGDEALGFYRPNFISVTYTNSPSDSVSLVVPPLELSGRTFSSNTYPSIEFLSASDAAFWGFDPRYSLTYPLPATPPWTYTQAGWVSGFLPPSTSTWDDSVAHKLCKSIRLLLGKQTIKEYTGEYVELRNDLLVPYENKAILKLMNGTLDPWQAITSREYYVSLPMGTHEFPLCALTQQQMSVEIDFEEYYNLSENLNQGTGSFVDTESFTTFDASAIVSPVNVQTTFSYQQYIFVVTYDGKLIVYDTTKSFTDPASYNVIDALAGSNNLKQFCVLAGNLYIGVSDGQLIRGNLEKLLKGQTSSFILNNYTPTYGSLTGTLVADFRYVYYSVSNTVTSNVFMTRYDTTGSFTSPSSYTSVDFSNTFNSSVTGVYQTLSTGTELIMVPQGVPGTLYTFQLNANVQSQWYVLDYSSYGSQITEGVVIGSSVYFVFDDFNILKYTDSVFTPYTFSSIFVVVTGNNVGISKNRGKSWSYIDSFVPGADLTYGNGIFLAVGVGGSTIARAYSLNDGRTWIAEDYGQPYCFGIVYGNDTFVCGSNNGIQYSIDGGITWTSSYGLGGFWGKGAFGNDVFIMLFLNDAAIAVSSDNGVSWDLLSIPYTMSDMAFANETFVAVGSYYSIYSIDNGQTWTSVPLLYEYKSVTFGGGTFVAVGPYHVAYSTDNGQTWTEDNLDVSGDYHGTVDIAYGDETFVVTAYEGKTAVSTDGGQTWSVTVNTNLNYSENIAVNPGKLIIPGDGFKNLMAMGNYIYCSTSNVAVRIDTTKDLSTAAAYEFPAPLPTSQYVMAHGPRYVYLFTQDPTQTTTATTITRFDPYGANTTFQASIIADYESLPSGTQKPDKAVLPLVQTQKVTDMTRMDLKGPIKELWFTGPSSSANVFQYSDLASQSVLSLTAGEPIVTEDVGTRTFLNTIQPFETHTAMPIRNVSVVSFEMNPESEVPDGTVNFSRIKDQVFEGGAQTAWADSVNLLAIQGGIGGLIFDS